MFVWLSFSNDGGFRGACVVEVTDDDKDDAREILTRLGRPITDVGVMTAAAIGVSHRDGCNPGGQVLAIELPAANWAEMRAYGCQLSRLLTKAQLHRFGMRPQ